MPRHIYGSFWCRTRIGWFLYVIFVTCICILNVSWFILDLLGHPVIAHFVIPKSIPAHSQYLSSLFSWFCSNHICMGYPSLK